MKRIQKLVAVAAGGILGAGLLSSCAGAALEESDAQSADSITVGLTYIPNVQFSPVYLADFSNVETPVVIRHHGTEEGLFSALSTGDEDVTVASGDEVLQARAQGLDVVSVGAYYHRYPVEVIVPEDSDIQSFADLKGRKIGVPGEFGSNWFGLLAALDEGGLSREDVNIVSVGFTQAAALVAGEVDAIVGFVNSEPVSLQQMGFASRSLALSPDETPLVGASIVTTEKFAASHSEELRAILGDITDGVGLAISDPELAVEATAKWDESLADSTATEGARAVLMATIPLWKDANGTASGIQNLDQWSEMGPFLARILDEPALTDRAEGSVTNEYVD